MKRSLLTLALAGLLAACQSQGSASEEPVGSGAAPGASSSAAAGGEPSAACAEAFAPLAAMNLQSVSELGDLEDEVTATIEGCESVDDWIAGADQVVANEVRPGAAELLLRIRCDQPGVGDTPICESL